MTCGVLTIHRDGLVATVNEHARWILDLGGRKAVGRPCEEVLERCPRLGEVLMASFGMASPPSRAELAIQSRDGRLRTIGFSISMIRSAPGRPPEGAALFFKDLTRVEEQEERERLRDRLAVLGGMAAQMAHEIRNPLTAIDVSATLQRRRLHAEGRPTDLVEKISMESRRIETTIANCLDYARPASLEVAPADPATILDEAISLACERARSASVVVERRFAPRLGTVFCDAAQIKEALVNILHNAHQAMHGEGRLRVSASIEDPRPLLAPDGSDGCEGGEEAAGAPPRAESATPGEQHLVIEVADTGPGIPPEFRDRVFNPFFTTKTTGSGIGLAAARKVVEAHGGWLDLESEPGGGATFILRLPLSAARLVPSRGARP
jgi:signal transduction histidine kinase